MSGKPYPEGVAEVLKLLEQLDALGKEQDELRPKVKRFEEVRTEIAVADGRLKELLESMDLREQGNAGFGSRMGWFLHTMFRLMRKAP